MNFKTKAIGLLAGSALALGLTTGAMAQQDTTDASATFGINDSGTCSIEFDVDGDENKSTLHLGDYEWDGDSYEFVDDSASSAQATVTQDIGPGSVNCYVTTTLAGALTNGGSSIAAGDVTLSINGGVASNVEVSTDSTSGGVVTISGSIDSGAITTSLATGNYTATLNVDSSDNSG